MKIAHLSDVHIQLLRRHDEYREVFSNLYTSLKKQKVDLIVICGDLFHSRVHLSPEAIDLVHEFLGNLSDIAQVILIAGNHDAILTATNSRLDAISPVVNSFNKNRKENKVLYFKDSGVYEYKNIDFGVYSVLDYLIPKKKDFREDSIKIALYHGMLKGAKLDNDRQVEKSEREIDFDFFDRVLMGDIHKLQKVGKNAYYSGSLVQRKFGEDPEKHGYLLHDTENLEKDPAFVKVKNSYGFYYLSYDGVTFKGTHTDITENADVRVNYPKHFDEQEVREAFVKKYPKYGRVYFDVKTDKERERNIDIKKDINELFTLENLNDLILQYYEDNKDMAEKMMSVNKEVYENIADKIKDNFVSGEYEIHSLEFDNVFAYGEGNIVDFKNLDGTVGLFSANRMGKTSFLNTIVIALYGNAQVINKQEKILNTEEDYYRTNIKLSKDGDIYEIKREGKRYSNSIKNEVVLLKNGNSIGGTINEVNKEIENLFGDYKTFYKLFYVSQASPEMFLNLTPMERKEWIYKNLGVDIFEFLHRFAKDKFNDISSKIEDLVDREFEEEKNIEKLNIEDSKKKLKKFEKKLSENEKNINEIQKEIDSIEIVEIDENIDIEMNKISEEISDIEKCIEDNKIEIEDKKDYLNNIEKHPDIISLEQSLESSVKDLEVTKQKINNNEESEEYKNVKNRLETVKESGSTLFKKKKELKNKLDSYNKTYKRDDVNDLFHQKRQLDQDISITNKDIDSIIEKINDYSNKASILKKDKRFENEELCQTCPLLKDAFEKRDEIKKLESDLKEKKSNIQDVKYHREKVSEEWEMSKEYVELLDKYEESFTKVNDLLEKMKSLEDQLEREEEIHKKFLLSEVEKYESDIERVKERIDDKKDSLRENLTSKIESLKSKIESSKEKIKNLNKQYSEFEEKKKEFEKNEQKIEKKKVLEQELSVHKQEKEKHNIIIGDINKDIGRYESALENIKSDEKRFEEYKSDIEKYEEYSKITHKNQLPLLFVENILDIFEAEINNIISMMSTFNIELRIDGNDIDSYMIEDGRKWSTDLCSGMEKFIINIAFRVAISKIGNIVSPNFMIIDEGFNALDKENSVAIPDIFNYLKKDFDHIFVVSHSDQYIDFVDYTLDIERRDGKSYISS